MIRPLGVPQEPTKVPHRSDRPRRFRALVWWKSKPTVEDSVAFAKLARAWMRRGKTTLVTQSLYHISLQVTEPPTPRRQREDRNG